jgi:hypothetical protein
MRRHILAMLECNFILTLRSFGDKNSDPTSKSLLGILRDLVDVLANMNQSWRRSRVEVLWDFPNACADLIITLLHFRHFLVQLAIGVMGDVS